jgi:hypothetical protein
VKNQFQNLPFNCNLQRYTTVVHRLNCMANFHQTPAKLGGITAQALFVVGLCRLNQVDP